MRTVYPVLEGGEQGGPPSPLSVFTAANAPRNGQNALPLSPSKR